MTELVLSQAEEWQTRFLSHIDGIARQWALIGAEVHECKEQRYYVSLGFTSFEGWVKSNRERIGKHRSTIFEARKMYRELSAANVQPEDMKLMSRANAKTLLMIPENHRAKPEIISKAQTLTEKEFSSTMGRQFKGWISDDKKVHWGVSTVESRATLIQEQIEQAQETYGLDSPAAVLEYALVHFNECRTAMSMGYGESGDGDQG